MLCLKNQSSAQFDIFNCKEWNGVLNDGNMKLNEYIAKKLGAVSFFISTWQVWGEVYLAFALI